MFASVEFSEGREMARVVVAVTGVFQRPLTIQISTVDSTATGTYMYIHSIVCNIYTCIERKGLT